MLLDQQHADTRALAKIPRKATIGPLPANRLHVAWLRKITSNIVYPNLRVLLHERCRANLSQWQAQEAERAYAICHRWGAMTWQAEASPVSIARLEYRSY